MRQPTSHDQERWWTEDGTGFYYLDKVSLVSAGEVDDMYDDERLLIMLPTAIAAVRPMALEIRSVSNNSNYSGTQAISDPLLVTLALCPDFTVRANAVPNLPQGGREVFDVIVARNAAMSDAVTVSVDIPPAGVTFSFAPQPLAPGTTTSVATMTATAAAGLGDRGFTITASGGGLTRTFDTRVNVVAADFTLDVTALPAVRQGTQRTFPLTVTRNSGMQSPVVLSATGQPAGVNFTFAPAEVAVAQSASTGTVMAALTAPVGAYQITFTGAGGNLTRTRTAQLQILPPDAHAVVDDVDCGCTMAADETLEYVHVAEPVVDGQSPDGLFTLATSGTTTIRFTLTHRDDASCVIPVGEYPAGAAYGFSPHSRYFVVSNTRNSNLRLVFYRLACDDDAVVPKIWEQSVFLVPADEWGVQFWGFSPDPEDRTFALIALSNETTSTARLINLKALFLDQPPTTFDFQAVQGTANPIRFSPCGDVAELKRGVNNNLQFNFVRTWDFGSLPPAGVTLVNSDNRDADPRVTLANHLIRTERSSDIVNTVHMPNTAPNACPIDQE
ncbi:MAG: COG1470 family protein [Gemmatimonadota bacterium]